MFGWLKRFETRDKPPQWKRDQTGAVPITPRAERRRKIGTAAAHANRGSEKLNRLIRSAFVAVFEMMIVILGGVLFGRLIYELYQGASWGRTLVQSVIGTIAAMTWLTFTRERYKDETRRAIRAEHEQRAKADQPHGAGADTTFTAGRGARVARVDDSGEAPTTRIPPVTDDTSLFDQHDPFDQRNRPPR